MSESNNVAFSWPTVTMADHEPFLSQYEWKPIDSYDGKSWALFRSDDRWIMGHRCKRTWYELACGDACRVTGFKPTLWAPLTAEQLEEWWNPEWTILASAELQGAN